MANPPVKLRQGENVWLLLATDKFGASADDVITDKVDGLAVALDAILSTVKSGQPVAPAPWQEIGTGNKTFRIGSARPVEVVSVTKTEPTLPKGAIVADRNQYPGEGVPTVIGQKPWWVLVRIWWRAPDTELPWPAFTERFPLLPDLEQVNGAEWVLAEAVWPDATTADPGEQSWGSAQADRAAKLGGSLFTGAITIGAAALAVVILIRTVRKPK